MKRWLCLWVSLGCFVLVTMAQPRLRRPEYYFGAQAGVLASMTNFSPTVPQSALHPFLGANAGLVFRYSGQKCCGLQVEFNYMQRGWKETDTGYRRELDYLEIPFLAHIYFGKKYRGFLNVGPQIGLRIREQHFDLPDQGKPQYLPIDKPFDWGLAAGLGFLARTKAGVWQIEARFNYSFGDTFANHKADYFAHSNAMNLSLNLGWLWEFKRHK